MANKKNIRKLVKALRSNAYHQATDVLCKVNKGQTKHCCLGVAGRLAIKEGMEIVTARKGDLVEFDYCDSDAPDSICNWLGIDKAQRNSLQTMNDRGDSFKEIADHLEEDYLK